MDSPTQPQQSPSPSSRSNIPIPKRKSSLHLYIANNISGGGSSNASSASSTHEDHASFSLPGSACSSRSATAMSMHSSLYVPRGGTLAGTSASAELQHGHVSSDYLQLRENHNRLINKCEEITKQNENLDRTNQLLKQSVAALQIDITSLKQERIDFMDKNRKLKKKLAEIVPTVSSSSSEDEDENKSSKSNSATLRRQHSTADPSKESEMDSLLHEMEKLKSYLNNVELQLYEANEKISELQESKQQYEDTNEKLRAENAELSKIARLMSVNMLESIDTSKRLESSFIQIRRERDQLALQSRDSVDSKTGPNEEIQKLRSEMENKRKTFEAQFIEYKSLMEQELSRITNEQIIALQLEVDRLKQDLEEAVSRAEKAEDEVRELTSLLRASQLQERQFYSQLDLDKLSLRNYGGDGDNDSLVSGMSSLAPAVFQSQAPPPPAPPPPPPPIPPPIPPSLQRTRSNSAASGSGAMGLSEAISTQKLNHIADKHKNAARSHATGLDSVIADIKSGRVTLRRRKPNVMNELEANATGASSESSATNRQSQLNYSQLAAKNPALREMYEVLERMKRRNRQSRVIVESELMPFKDPSSREETNQDADSTDGVGSGYRMRTVITGVVDV